jgi:hypothetical protein
VRLNDVRLDDVTIQESAVILTRYAIKQLGSGSNFTIWDYSNSSKSRRFSVRSGNCSLLEAITRMCEINQVICIPTDDGVLICEERRESGKEVLVLHGTAMGSSKPLETLEISLLLNKQEIKGVTQIGRQGQFITMCELPVDRRYLGVGHFYLELKESNYRSRISDVVARSLGYPDIHVSLTNRVQQIIQLDLRFEK